MNYSQDHKEVFKKQIKVISAFMDDPEFGFLNQGSLKAAFFENLSEILQIALDLNLEVDKLKLLTEKLKKADAFPEMTNWISSELDKIETYILLNFFCFTFIQACVDVLKEGERQKLEKLLVEASIQESEMTNILTDYNYLVAQKTLKS